MKKILSIKTQKTTTRRIHGMKDSTTLPIRRAFRKSWKVVSVNTEICSEDDGPAEICAMTPGVIPNVEITPLLHHTLNVGIHCHHTPNTDILNRPQSPTPNVEILNHCIRNAKMRSIDLHDHQARKARGRMQGFGR
mmetsp:Transcript_24273/g.58591  ORF Transcript_24273/g.58591 Transcript_24273/m.58591 type:complete len:136 (-) Transcript_24273:647-1054(-)